jgi:hypothetical protein
VSRLARRGDAGSMPLAVLLTMVGVSLSALMAPMVLTQIRAARENVTRTYSLAAAQSGLDVALAHLRAANDGAGTGVRASLPCGPFTGTVGQAGNARYQVTVEYFGTDPLGQSAAWRTANRLTCTAGSGPATIPAYALLTAQGTNEASGAFGTVPGRSLRATYAFQTTVENITGGVVRVYRTATSADLCLDAGSGAPTAGTSVRLQACDAASVQQRFAYNPNLTLALVASRTPTAPLGMCLDAGAAPAAGAVVQFRSCASTTSPQQQWLFNDYGNFEGTADGLTASGLCLNVQTRNTAGSFVILGSTAATTCRQAYDNVETFTPDPAAGVGAAGSTAGQVVDFGAYARCLDVTAQVVASTYLIATPCTQAPDATRIGWDQKWTLPAVGSSGTSTPGQVSTVAPGGSYCLRSPGSTSAGQYVTVTTCPAGSTPVNLTWTRTTATGTYTTSYRLVDGYGFCLAPTDPTATPADLHNTALKISKLVVAVCDGSATQKWNAPAGLQQALPIKDVFEP